MPADCEQNCRKNRIKNFKFYFTQKQCVIKNMAKTQKKLKKGVDIVGGLFYTVNHRPMRCG